MSHLPPSAAQPIALAPVWAHFWGNIVPPAASPILMIGLCVLLFGYLVAALLWPEKF